MRAGRGAASAGCRAAAVDEPARLCQIQWLGRQPYRAAWALQDRLAAAIAAGAQPPTLLLLEHPPTYTFGRSGRAENLRLDSERLAALGIEVVWTDRGGDVTYHGPGQLVGYPLLPLGRLDDSGRIPQADYVGHVRRLEETLIHTLAGLGLASGQIPGRTGVWVQPDVASRCPHCPPAARRAPSKIAAIGVRVDRFGVSRHGFALNLETDPEHWEGIIACGLADAPIVSLADLLTAPPALEELAERAAASFGTVFNCRTEWAGRARPVTGAAAA